MNNPLKVRFDKLSGKFYLLQYSASNIGTKIILARTSKGLIKTADRAFAENPDATIHDYRLIEIVAPSKKMIEKAEQFFHDTEVRVFLDTITYDLKYNFKDGYYPGPFTACNNWEGEDSEDIESEDIESEDHFDCLNCSHRIRLIGMTPNELYEKYSARWYKLTDVKPYDSHWRYSQAEVAKDKETIFALDVSCSASLFEVTDYFQDDLAFYFRHLKSLDYSHLQNIVDIHLEKWKAALAEKQLKQESYVSEFDVNKIKQLKLLFGE